MCGMVLHFPSNKVFSETPYFALFLCTTDHCQKTRTNAPTKLTKQDVSYKNFTTNHIHSIIVPQYIILENHTCNLAKPTIPQQTRLTIWPNHNIATTTKKKKKKYTLYLLLICSTVHHQELQKLLGHIIAEWSIAPQHQ